MIRLYIMTKLTLPAELENLQSMLKFIRDGAEKLGLESKKMNQIQMASEEALANVISYAYPDAPGNVEITHSIEEGKRLVIQIVDWGIAFDPLSRPDPDAETPMEEREIGGWGIFMMKKIMDEVHYKREGDRNILILVKQ